MRFLKRERETECVREGAERSGERAKVEKSGNFKLIMDYCEVVVDIAKTNAIAQQNRLLKTIFYQTKFRIQRATIPKSDK